MKREAKNDGSFESVRRLLCSTVAIQAFYFNYTHIFDLAELFSFISAHRYCKVSLVSCVRFSSVTLLLHGVYSQCSLIVVVVYEV